MASTKPRIRCRVVYDGSPVGGVQMEFARVPAAGERIELPNAQHVAVEEVVWVAEERTNWIPQTTLRSPSETRPTLLCQEVTA